MTAPRARRMTRSARGCRRSRKRKQFLRGKGEEKDYSRGEVEGKPGRSGVVANSRFLTGKERRFGMTKCNPVSRYWQSRFPSASLRAGSRAIKLRFGMTNFSTCTTTEGRVVP